MLKAEETWSEEVANQLIWEKYYSNKGLLESEMYYKKGLLVKEVYYDEEGKLLQTNKN